MCVSGSFDSKFVHLIKSTGHNFGVYSSAVVILAWREYYACVYSSFLMWKNNRNAFCKTRAARNSCSKGNIDRSKSAVTVMNASFIAGCAINCVNSRLAKLSFEGHSSYHSPVGGNPMQLSLREDGGLTAKYPATLLRLLFTTYGVGVIRELRT